MAPRSHRPTDVAEPSAAALPSARFSVTVSLLVLGTLLIGAIAWALGVGPRSSDGEPVPEGPVALIGVPGLSWDDVAQGSMPTLTELARDGAVGSMVVRGAPRFTCAADGWLTLSAGQRAVAQAPDEERLDCPDLELPPVEADGTLTWPQWADWQRSADARAMRTELGSLQRAVPGCVLTQGPGAAAGGAAPDGTAQVAGETSLDSCPVLLVDLGQIAHPRAASSIDAALADVIADLPEDATVIVAGLADRDDSTERAGLRTVVVHGAGTGELTSASTRQPGLIQTSDLTVTLIRAAGGVVPDAVVGQQVRVLAGEVDLQRAFDTASAGTAAAVLAGPAFGALAAVLLVALLGCWLVGRGRAGATVLTLAQAVPVAAFLACVVPWWRTIGSTGIGTELTTSVIYLALAMLAAAVLVTALAWWAARRQGPLGAPMVVAAITLVVLGLDVIWGSRWALLSPLGVLPTSGGRFFGVGNVAAGILLGAMVVLAAGVVAGVRRRVSPLAAAALICAIGFAIVLVDGLPHWGADFGGVPALVVATGMLAIAAAGWRMTVSRALMIGVAAVAAAAALMFIDWLRPEQERTHLGAFAQQVLDGEAWTIVARKAEQSLSILLNYPASWLGVALLVALGWAVLARESRAGRAMQPLWQLPGLHSAGLALLIGSLIGWAVNDSGIALLALSLVVGGTGLLAARVALPAPVGSDNSGDPGGPGDPGSAAATAPGRTDDSSPGG